MTACCLGGAVMADDSASPFDFGVLYTSEIWRNVSGGREQGSVYLDNLDATLEIDAERLFGWRGTRVLLYGLYNNGRSLSGEKVGDLQVVSNIETGVEAARLYEAWIETPVTDRGSLLVGLYDLNREFDVLESAVRFINSAHGIGTDFGQSGRNGPSIFPVTSLALRFAWQWNDRIRWRAAVLDGVPGDPDDPGATTIDLGGGDGALLVGEIEWAQQGRRLLAGAWGYTADFPRWPDPAAPGPTRRGDGNGGLYLRGETPLGAGGATLFARVGVADGDYNPFSGFLGAGVEWAGSIAARPQDSFGIAIALAETSNAYRRAFDAEPREFKLEMTYRMPIGERITLQPDLQYIRNPGLDPTLDDAWAIGLRFELTLLP